MPLKFWDEAFVTVVFLINRLPSRVIDQETPFFRLYGRHPDYNFLKTFGCACWPNMRPYNDRKLEFLSKRCVFLGYSHQHKGYKCLEHATGRVYISRDVIFDEHLFPFASLHPNAGAQLRGEIALLPDSFLNPPPSMPSSHGELHVLGHRDGSPLSTNDSQRSVRDLVNTGENSGQIRARMGHDFMCLSSRDSASIEDAPPSVAAETGGVSTSGISEAQEEGSSAPSDTAGAGSSATSSSEAPTDPSPMAAHQDPGAAVPTGSAAVPSRSSVEPLSAASPAPSMQQGPVTRLQRGISKPKIYSDGTIHLGMSANVAEEPTSVDQA
jgi:hypothetical protein